VNTDRERWGHLLLANRPEEAMEVALHRLRLSEVVRWPWPAISHCDPKRLVQTVTVPIHWLTLQRLDRESSIEAFEHLIPDGAFRVLQSCEEGSEQLLIALHQLLAAQASPLPRSAACRQRVDPAQSGKTAEVAVVGMHHRLGFDR
jgi:hypothetical protein